MVSTQEQEELLETLYREMHDKLVKYAYCALMDYGRAEEAVQDTFSIACIRIDVLESSEVPCAWLMKTLKNVISNMRRSQERLKKLVITTLNFEEEMYVQIQENNVDLLYSGIIKDEDFLLLKLIAIDNYTMQEAAATLGINIEACKKRVQRAKKKFKSKLESDY